jgi:Ca2+-binding EF-hand superfamily protein
MRDTERKSARRIAAAVLVAGGLVGDPVGAQSNAPSYDPRAAFSQTDHNHDGVVDYEEFTDRMAEVFFQADVNKDGELSAAECTATLVQTENLTKADSNHDGQLTLHEFMRARLKDYELVDTNHDGLLELDEVIRVYEAAVK